MVQTRLPHDIGAIHFVGIGGIGMSGIAEVLLEPRLHGAGLGPRSRAPITERLEAKGARVFIGQKAENLEGARGGGDLLGDQARQPRARRGAGEEPAAWCGGRRCWPS